MSILTFESVSFKYPGANTPYILKDANVTFDQGVFYSIIGPSGSGKTTALALAGGLDVPSSGVVRFDGKDLKEIGYTAYRRRCVALVFQNYNLISYMNAVENVMLTMEIAGTHKGERRQRAEELLGMLGLPDSDIHRPVTRLSGGQQQRVAIARALAGDAPLILADEPTGNLDADSTGEIIVLFQRLAQELDRCVVVVSHSSEVARASDQILCFKGKTLEPVGSRRDKAAGFPPVS